VRLIVGPAIMRTAGIVGSIIGAVVVLFVAGGLFVRRVWA
jgi:hypothetical protein